MRNKEKNRSTSFYKVLINNHMAIVLNRLYTLTNNRVDKSIQVLTQNYLIEEFPKYYITRINKECFLNEIQQINQIY